MEKTELRAIRTRLQNIIKECRAVTKLIDKELDESVDSVASTEQNELPILAHNATLNFKDHKQILTQTFGRKDIEIYIGGMSLRRSVLAVYTFNIIKDSTLTTIHVHVDQTNLHEMKAFREMLHQTRFKPMSLNHLKSLLNKASEGVSKIITYTNTYGGLLFINVVSTNAQDYGSVRHRNTTYLFDPSLLGSLSGYQQIMVTMHYNGAINI